MDEPQRYAVDCRKLPPDYPTHLHPPAFWELLGCIVATFEFLEEALLKAIFAFTGMRQIPEEDADAEYHKWLKTLEKAVSDPLGKLIDSYGKAVRSHGCATIANLVKNPNLFFIIPLRKRSPERITACHISCGDAGPFTTRR